MDNIDVLVSIIVPVYKVEKYLHRCIDSIINQSYRNLEIILVDDGSPDNCGKVCDEYAEQDKRIKVIHKSNGGLSSARNAGLDIANGDYIYFVDSDDYIDTRLVEDNLQLAIEYKADIVCFNLNIIKNGNIIKGFSYFEKNIYDTKILKDGLYRGYISEVVWNKLYKRNIWNYLRFPEGINFEDSYIITDILAIASKIIANSNVYYFYNQDNDNAITHTTKNINRQLIKLFISKHKLDNVKSNYQCYYQQCLADTLNIHIKMYCLNKYKKIVDNSVNLQWKNFVLSNYKECIQLNFKKRVYIWGIKNCELINYLKGIFEYYKNFRT